ncbi:MAG: PfkB family carbohydrate kinase, partial [Candidatus Competibacteraceae bacterium]|nr:PfkB family carbohydrate kinase [Candidatus Competibacteraceae bacterium]
TLTYPVSEAATLQGVQLARQAGALVSFDPNLRFSLWPDPATARTKIEPLLGSADVLKVGEEELAFLLETEDEQRAVGQLLERGTGLVVVTRGKDGSSFYTRHGQGHVPVPKVKAVDATGAGDAFVGGLLLGLAELNLDRGSLERLDAQTLESLLRFANACGAITATGRGAIPSLPTRQQVEALGRS